MAIADLKAEKRAYAACMHESQAFPYEVYRYFVAPGEARVFQILSVPFFEATDGEVKLLEPETNKVIVIPAEQFLSLVQQRALIPYHPKFVL